MSKSVDIQKAAELVFGWKKVNSVGYGDNLCEVIFRLSPEIKAAYDSLVQEVEDEA